MKRREFITLIAGAAAALPVGARAQRAERMRRLGMLMSNSEDDPLAQARVTAFRQALAELGWVEGRNLNIEWRWTGGDIARVREYATELVRLAPDVIVANGTPSVAALKQATTSIPIVFVVVNDPVAQGIIVSMAHPGRQYHRLFIPRLFDGRKVAGDAQTGRTRDRPRRHHVQPGHLSLLRPPSAIVRDGCKNPVAAVDRGAGP